MFFDSGLKRIVSLSLRIEIEIEASVSESYSYIKFCARVSNNIRILSSRNCKLSIDNYNYCLFGTSDDVRWFMAATMDFWKHLMRRSVYINFRDFLLSRIEV